MALREIEESEFIGKQQLVNLVQRIQNNPKSRELFEKALKTVDPNSATPITDAKAEVMAEVEKEREARLALKAEIDKDKEERAAQAKLDKFRDGWERQKAKLQTARGGGYTDEGVAAIEKLAEERGIADLEAAEALFARLNPPKETPIQPNGMGLFNMFEPSQRDDEQFKKLFDSAGDDTMALQSLVDSALSEARGGRR